MIDLIDTASVVVIAGWVYPTGQHSVLGKNPGRKHID